MAKEPEPIGEVRLWLASVAEIEDPGNAAAALAVLDPDERRHAGRFDFAQDRNAFLASRSLRRHVLSYYAGIDPEQWRFTSNSDGRPRIGHPMLNVQLEFNMSRSGGLVVCAVAHGVAVGVDIERLDRAVPAGAVESVLAPSEIPALKGLSINDRDKRFYSHWTLKEAYLKARGVGLSVPLDSVAFDVADDPDLNPSLVSSASGDVDEWQFMLLSPAATHIMAVCVQCRREIVPHVVMRWVSAVQVPR